MRSVSSLTSRGHGHSCITPTLTCGSGNLRGAPGSLPAASGYGARLPGENHGNRSRSATSQATQRGAKATGGWPPQSAGSREGNRHERNLVCTRRRRLSSQQRLAVLRRGGQTMPCPSPHILLTNRGPGLPGEEAPVLRSHQHPRDLAPTHLQHRACGTQKGTIMVNDTVKYAGLHMTEETFKVSDKPILLTSLLFDRSSSEDQPVAGPGAPCASICSTSSSSSSSRPSRRMMT